MTMPYIAPILLLCVSNVFMTFAWARSGPAMPDAKRQWHFASDERAELERGAGEADAVHPNSFERVA
jgi:hypothetical protein